MEIAPAVCSAARFHPDHAEYLVLSLVGWRPAESQRGGNFLYGQALWGYLLVDRSITAISGKCLVDFLSALALDDLGK